MAAEDLVKDRITRKNNPNLKNISSIQLMSSPEHKRDYIEALQGQEERLMSDQKEKQKSKMNSIKKTKKSMNHGRGKAPRWDRDARLKLSDKKMKMSKSSNNLDRRYTVQPSQLRAAGRPNQMTKSTTSANLMAPAHPQLPPRHSMKPTDTRSLLLSKS